MDRPSRPWMFHDHGHLCLLQIVSGLISIRLGLSPFPQMRFMKYVYAHVDGQQAGKAHARPMTQLAGAGKPAEKIQARRSCSGGGKEPFARNSPASRVEGALVASHAPPVMGRAEACEAYTIVPSKRGMAKTVREVVMTQHHGGGGNGNSRHRQQLLEKKRGILLAMKGVVGRQAEALDRLVESSANYNLSRKSRSFQRTNGSSTTSSCLLRERRKSDGGSRAGSKALLRGQTTQKKASCLDASSFVDQNSRTVLSPFIARAKAALPSRPPRPPENDTSAFLARGGRWGRENRQGTSSTRNSLSSVSSASYATYCERDRAGGGAVRGVDRRPEIVPALPV